MSISDDRLRAYADGELSAPEHNAERLLIESAMRADPAIARRVEQHRAMRTRVNRTYDRVLDEPVPERLLALVRDTPARAGTTKGSGPIGVLKKSGDGHRTRRFRRADDRGSTSGSASNEPHVEPPRSASVTNLNRVRAAKSSNPAAHPSGTPQALWTWPQWGAIAASLAIGAVIAGFVLESVDLLGPIGTRGGRLLAQGGLDRALTQQLASEQTSDAPVSMGVSFRSKAGDYCRTFVLEGEPALGGFACHEAGEWRVHTLARIDDANAGVGSYRPAASSLPPAVLSAVEAQIVGEPLDANAEAQAQKNGWK